MAAHVNGNDNIENGEEASMLEQILPETSMHVLSYLDYQSLCRLSMTNSPMRRAANDDNVWKALYHKDFNLEQDSVTPANGWKAYYAATRAIVTTNTEFFRIFSERSLQDMGQFWLNADYVSCFYPIGKTFSGYDAVIESWQLLFGWENFAAYEMIQDVRARVTADIAWVTMKAFLHNSAYNLTSVYEFHEGRWFMVHHHNSPVPIPIIFDP